MYSPSVFLRASGTAVPRTRLTTEALLEAHGHLLSPGLSRTIARMGVHARHVTLRNAPAFLTGREPSMDLDGDATTLAVDALIRCHDAAGGWAASDVGLLVAVTNTQARLLPGLAPEIVAHAPNLLRRDASLLNLQGQGCSGLQKAVELASWYLAGNPGKRVAVVASEANSTLAPLVRDRDYLSFGEIARELRPGADWVTELEKTGAMVQNFLFGDGACAFLLGSDDGRIEFGPTRHLTNTDPEHQELVRIEGGGSAQPLVGPSGRPVFRMEPGVLGIGPEYVSSVIRAVLAVAPFGVSALDGLDPLYLHTGSAKVLDGVCDALGVPRDAARVAPGYAVLREFGNLSSASIGFMIDRGSPLPGVGLMAGFGGGFSATATALRVL